MQAKLFVIGIGIAMTLILFSVTCVLRDLDFCLSPAPFVSESSSLCRKVAFFVILLSSMRIVLSENTISVIYLLSSLQISVGAKTKYLKELDRFLLRIYFH